MAADGLVSKAHNVLWERKEKLKKKTRYGFSLTPSFNGEPDATKQGELHISNATRQPMAFDHPIITPLCLITELPHSAAVVPGRVEVVGQHAVHKLSLRLPATLLPRDGEIGELVAQPVNIRAGIAGDEKEE
jgi:hypothetical protein